MPKYIYAYIACFFIGGAMLLPFLGAHPSPIPEPVLVLFQSDITQLRHNINSTASQELITLALPCATDPSCTYNSYAVLVEHNATIIQSGTKAEAAAALAVLVNKIGFTP